MINILILLCGYIIAIMYIIAVSSVIAGFICAWIDDDTEHISIFIKLIDYGEELYYMIFRNEE